MDTGTHWKRPWEGGVRAEAPPARHNRPTNPHESPVAADREHERNVQRQDNVSTGNKNGAMASADSRPSSKGSDGPPDTQHPLLHGSHKRQRLDTLEDFSGGIQSPTPRTISTSLGLRLEGVAPSTTESRRGSTVLRFGSTECNKLGVCKVPRELETPSVSYMGKRPPTQTLCPGCSGLDLVRRVVTGLNKLHEDLYAGVNRELTDRQDMAVALPAIDQQRSHLSDKETLDQGLDKLEASIDLLKNLKISLPQVSQANGSSVTTEEQPLCLVHSNEATKENTDKEDRFANQLTHHSSPASDDGLRSTEGQCGTASGGDDHRRSFPRDSTSHVPFSLHPLTSTPKIGPSGLLLPSPSSMNFSTSSINLPPMSPSLLQSKSPHTAHLQELQHQLSTKSLAYQILQGEHDKLLAAFSRSQTRCATLDRRSQVSDEEINHLAEDRLRLQAQVDAFEAQIEALQNSKNEALKQSVSSGTQYMQIMSMSSRLQEQGAAELKKWKQDRDTWQQEKDQLLSQIAVLTDNGKLSVRSNQDGGAPATSIEAEESGTRSQAGSPDVLHSPSVESLRADVVRLRARNHAVETLLQSWAEDSDRLDKLLQGLGEVGDRMRQRRAGSEIS